MTYISLFSGIGGLEAADTPPLLCCEMDPACQRVLRRRFPDAAIHPDVTTLQPPKTEVVVGGWPCQDISVAGLQRGLAGERSGLFFRLLDVARWAGAHTVVAENVPNLLFMERGNTFRAVLRAFAHYGYGFVAWRLLNARRFGLPHQRERVFIIASQHQELAWALHRDIPVSAGSAAVPDGAAGFYWTAGNHSICYSRGFVPTLKVGSALSIPSPPALHYGSVLRKASAMECLALQGFVPPETRVPTPEFSDLAPKDLYRMSGNAVARTVGKWVMASLSGGHPVAAPKGQGGLPFAFADSEVTTSGRWSSAGYQQCLDPVDASTLSSNLDTFIDREDPSRLSGRAAAGLLKRLVASGRVAEIDPGLRALIQDYAGRGPTGDSPAEDGSDEAVVETVGDDPDLEGPPPSSPQGSLF